MAQALGVWRLGPSRLAGGARGRLIHCGEVSQPAAQREGIRFSRWSPRPGAHRRVAHRKTPHAGMRPSRSLGRRCQAHTELTQASKPHPHPPRGGSTCMQSRDGADWRRSGVGLELLCLASVNSAWPVERIGGPEGAVPRFPAAPAGPAALPWEPKMARHLFSRSGVADRLSAFRLNRGAHSGPRSPRPAPPPRSTRGSVARCGRRGGEAGLGVGPSRGWAGSQPGREAERARAGAGAWPPGEARRGRGAERARAQEGGRGGAWGNRGQGAWACCEARGEAGTWRR